MSEVSIKENETGSEVLTGSVYDAELGKFIKIDPERQRVAIALQQRLDMATLVTAVALKKISDDKYFLELGYSSFKEFANTALPFKEGAAKMYLKIGRKFADLLPDGWEQGQSIDLLEGQSEDGAGKLGSLGVAKLYELTRIDDADFSEVVSEGIVKLEDGSELNLDEIKQNSAKDLRERINATQDYQRELEAELDKVVRERDKAISEKEKALQEAETGMKYKDLYGPRSQEYDAFKSRIAVAHARALDLNQALSQIVDLPAEEFESLKVELQGLHKLIDRGLSALREDNLEAFK